VPSEYKTAEVLHSLSVVESMIMRNRSTQHLTFYNESFTFVRLLGSVSGHDRREEAIMIGPTSRNVGFSLPSGRKKRKGT
jgi:hypothetical protein